MDKHDRLQKLFDGWKTRDHYVQANQFLRDGIIDESKYVEESPKLLFIGKEANDLPGGDYDLTKNWSNRNLSGLYDKRIAQWAFGIQSDFHPYDCISGKENRDKRYEALQKVAIMEIRKCSGGSSSDNLSLQSTVEKDRDLLHDQIDIIDPDIIICCLVDQSLVMSLFQNFTFIKSGYERCVFKWKNYKVIDFYHPSFQTVPAASYSLLQNIYQSKAFKSL